MMNNCPNRLLNNCCHRNCCHNQTQCGNIFPVPGPQGPAGTSATVTIGSTTTGEPGTPVTVTNSGTTSNAVLNFVIPRGNDGNVSTIEIGTTTTLPPGSNATVENVGTNTNAILNFGIPTGNSLTIDSGNFISRNAATYTNANSIISLPITLNGSGITINANSVISISKAGRYLINYGVKTTTIGNIIGIYINGVNRTNTNINSVISDLNPSASIILELNKNDVITLGAVNADETLPLTLENNTINAFITLISLD